MAWNVGLKSFRGSLETALESDDISPLLSLVCTSSAKQTTSADPSSPSHAGNDRAMHIVDSTLEAVVSTLKSISERREQELRRTCETNEKEIQLAMQELASIQSIAADLRRRAQDTTSTVQRALLQHSNRIDALNETMMVRDRIELTRAVISTATHLLTLCQEARESIMERDEIYHARKILIHLKTRYGSALKTAMAQSKRSTPVVENVHNVYNVHDDKGLAAHLSRPLTSRILSQITILDNLIDVKVNSAINEWLTEARAAAATIGKQALDAAHLKSIRQETFAKQRVDSISLRNQVNTVGATVADSKSISALDFIRQYDTGVNKNLLQDWAVPSQACDLTLLLRCVHLHSIDNTLPQLLETYVAARQAQLGADLVPPSNFLTNHDQFLCQIVGFFVLEYDISTIIPQLEIGSHIEAAWEGASAALAAEVGAAIDEASDREDLLKLKTQALLVCDAIDSFCKGSLSTRGIRSTLSQRIERYRSILARELSTSIFSDIFVQTTTSADTTKDSTFAVSHAMAMVVEDVMSQCREYMFGLVDPQELDGSSLSECDTLLAMTVADKLASFVVAADDEDYEDDEELDEEEGDGSSIMDDDDDEGYIVESDGNELDDDHSNDGNNEQQGVEVTKRNTDLSNDQENNETLKMHREHEGEEDNDDRDQALAALYRLICLTHAAQTCLESKRLALFGGSAPSLSTIPTSTTPAINNMVSTQLSGTLVTTEDTIAREIGYDAETSVDALAELEWTPVKPSSSSPLSSTPPPPCISSIVDILLDYERSMKSANVPEPSIHRILCDALHRIGQDILHLVASSEVHFINAHGAQHMVHYLEILLKRMNEGSARSVTGGAHSRLQQEYKRALQEPLTLFQALASNKIKEFLDEKKRATVYAMINFDRFVKILEKVVDTVSLGERVLTNVVTKAHAVETAKALRI